jgi:hypothetical protein
MWSLRQRQNKGTEGNELRKRRLTTTDPPPLVISTEAKRSGGKCSDTITTVRFVWLLSADKSSIEYGF